MPWCQSIIYTNSILRHDVLFVSGRRKRGYRCADGALQRWESCGILGTVAAGDKSPANLDGRRVDILELEQAAKRVEELREIIEKNNRLYYDQDAPELEDFEYDALNRELKELEA